MKSLKIYKDENGWAGAWLINGEQVGVVECYENYYDVEPASIYFGFEPDEVFFAADDL